MPNAGPLELVLTLAILAIYLVPVALVVVLIRRRRTPAGDVRDVLRSRLARGEIDEAEYLRLSSVISSR